MRRLRAAAFMTAIAIASPGCATDATEESAPARSTASFEPAEVETGSAPTIPARATFAMNGNFQQGGVVRGQAPDTTRSLTLNGTPVSLADDGSFIIAFGRDHSGPAQLVATLTDGQNVIRNLEVRPTDWRLQHVNASPRGGVSSEAFRRRRAPELARIVAAREIRSGAEGWRQDFVWPVTGRISGVFGSQRIYRGTPGSYHSGVDIARPAGTPIIAPADGVVILATDSPFTLEGNLLMIDHGMGLNSAFLHLTRIDVREGEQVTQGQRIGTVGASGRATGPHLHWSMKWGPERIDPQLLAGPMQGSD